MMKHCVIRHSHFSKVMGEIVELSKAGFKTRWSCKKANGQWTATSTRPVAASIQQLQRAVA